MKKSLEFRINRFIEALSKRRDPNLNKFFIEIIQEVEAELESDLFMKSEILEIENQKLKQVLSLFTPEQYYNIFPYFGQLQRMKVDKYYTASSLAQDMADIKTIQIIKPETGKIYEREKISKIIKQIYDELGIR